MHLRLAVLIAGLALSPSGCLVLKKQHDEVAARVSKLETQNEEQQKALEQSLERADQLASSLESKLKEAEALLRRNQADIGLRVDELEMQATQLRGAVENAEFVATAGTQEVSELRADLDARLKTLEEKLNEATNIPEDKAGLWAEAERQMKRKNYVQSRKLWRTYQSRYPDDPKLPDVRFQVGLTYFQERDYKSALGEFYRIIQESPNAAVVPDALYYSGLAFAKLGQCQNAIAYFKALQKPKSTAPDRYRDAATKQIDILAKDKGELCVDKGDKGAGSAAEHSIQK